ncbi:MAG: RNA methyltransferase [Pseudomonadales bacterium]
MREVRIVLVEPSHPGNIGGAARAMKTMGQTDLVIVKPRRYPDPQADWRAASALDVLDAARVVDTIAEATAGCAWVIGTSTRLRRIPWPVVSPREMSRELENIQGSVAILFGREDSGLTNDELRACNYHLQIPANPDYPSLNLAMAVQVVCYELFQSAAEQPQAAWDRRWATHDEVDGMLTHLQQALTDSGFIDADNPGQTMTRLRRIFKRIQLDETEVDIVRGIAKHILQDRGS